jgi:myo-inositol 2-dehydrogenase/D-chiro-inositol 1-dehydrogenase
MVKVAVIGAGYIAQSHAAAYDAHDGAHLAYVTDPVTAKAEALAERHGARSVGSLEDLLASDVEAVSVCTPSPTHADVVVAALEAGKHVLCEKPLARTSADGRRLVEADRQSAGLLMIGHVSRFEPDHRAACDAVREGRIGQVRMMAQSIVGELPTWSEQSWLTDPAQSGGPLVDLAVHSFDYLTWVSGATPERVHAVGSTGPDGFVDYSLVTLKYDNGALAVVEASWAHPAGHGLDVATELSGTEGRIAWDYAGTAVGAVKRAGEPRLELTQLGDRGFRAEIAAFLEAVENGAPSPVPAEEGLLALEVALAAAESLRTRRAVRLPYKEGEKE